MDLSKLINNKDEQAEAEYQSSISKEEYAAMKQAEREDIWNGIDATAKDVFVENGTVMSFLDFVARNSPQTASNLLLLYSQEDEDRPLTQVKTFEKWKELGRSIKSGENGYPYLVSDTYERDDGTMAQGYNIKKGFDVSQTRGRQPQPMQHKSVDELIAAIAANPPVKLQISDQLPEGIEAQYVPQSRTVFVRNGMDETVTFLSLIRELAHASYAKECAAGGNTVYSRNAYAAKAYCAAYVVGKKYGVDVSTFDFSAVCEKLKDKSPEGLRHFIADMKSAAYAVERNINRGLGVLEQVADVEFSDAMEAPPSDTPVVADTESAALEQEDQAAKRGKSKSKAEPKEAR